MRNLTRGFAVAALALLLAAPVVGAQAATSPDDVADDVTLEAYLDTLDTAEREEFIETMLPATESVTVGPQAPANAQAYASAMAARMTGVEITPLAVGCWTQRWTWGPKAAAGNTLYTYYHVGYWCSSGSTVTAASVQDYGAETKTPGWRVIGSVSKGAAVVSNQGRSGSQHTFALGVGGWDVQTPVHCARVKGLSNGTSTADSVCGV
ncbi:hypothetical protein, partial [Demequina pelophila]|uniref:hypothetical protein n=1 Tax=Demequina pelophila TaxID=1638984 RepID=UPI0012E0B7DB